MLNGLMLGNAGSGSGTSSGGLNFYWGNTLNSAHWYATPAGASLNWATLVGTTGCGSLIEQNQSGLTVGAAGNSMCGIAFHVPTTTSSFLINATIYGYQNGGTAMALSLFDVVNDIGPFPNFVQPKLASNNESTSMRVSAIYTPGVAATCTIQLLVNNLGTGGTIIIGDNQFRNLIPSVFWEVIQIE